MKTKSVSLKIPNAKKEVRTLERWKGGCSAPQSEKERVETTIVVWV